MTFSGKLFFPSIVPEFLHVLFSLVEKHYPVSFLTEMLLFGFVAFIIFYINYFVFVFLSNKVQASQKNTWAWFTT